MLQRLTYVYVSDNTFILWLRVFHTYGGFSRRFSYVNNYLKGSARVVRPARREYKGFKVKITRKGAISRLLIIKTNLPACLYFGGGSSLLRNCGIGIKKNRILKGKYVYGTCSKNVRQRRFRTLFSRLL